MKLTGILLLAGCLQLSAKGITQTISLSVKDAPLVSVLKAIEKQTEFVFFVNNKDLQKAGKISLTVNNIPLQQVLDLCFKNQPLTYAITGKVITVSLKEEKTGHVSSFLNEAPRQDIKGRIVNENGDPVLASVTVKGTGQGTTTNENGEFTLPGVPDNAVLVISGVGLETKELKLAGNNSPLFVTVKIAIAPLDETVIRAYGTTTRKFNTGNISKVQGTDIEKQPIGDPVLALQGRVPGLQISLSSGIPGARINVQLRGQNSLRADANNPLFIIDGIPFPSTTLTSQVLTGAGQLSPFSSVNMDDIESIEVLKDADATAIYGSRGANGVILITTKKGKAGRVKIAASISSGQGKITRRLDMLNTEQYLEMRHEAYRNDGVNTISSADYDINGTWDTTRYTDWQKVFIGNTSHLTNAQLSMSGGNDLTQFLIGGSFRKETTVFPGDYNDKKSSVFLNVTNKSSNRKFTSQLSASYLNDNNLLPTTDLTSYIFSLPPDAPAIYNSDGTLNWAKDTWNNPFGALQATSTSLTTNLIGNLNLSYTLLPGLDIKTGLGYNKVHMDQDLIFPLSQYSPSFASYSAAREHQFGNTNITTWNVEPQLTYSHKISNGKLDALLGATFQETINESIAQDATNFLSDALIDNILAASSIRVMSTGYTQYKYSSVFARIGYNWKERYLINLTGRRDGSTKFGSGSQFGNFGAIGAGWIFSKEEFIKNGLSFLSYGKIRGSYGTTGNDQIPPYQYLSSYLSYSPTYLGSAGLYASRIANPYYKWEMVKKLEFGLELGFIKDRILIYSSYYRNRTEDQLVGYSLPGMTGFTSVQANLPAVIQNNGLEFELNTSNIQGKEFSWKTSFNIAFPKNKLVAFPNISASSYATTYQVGSPLSESKKYQYLGVDPQTGIIKYQDVNGDGLLTTSQDAIFSPGVFQKYFGGLNNSFSYKGISLDIFFQFVKQTGTLILWQSIPGVPNQNQPTAVLERWRKPGDVTVIPKFTQSLGTAFTAVSNFSSSDGQIADASFIRLKNVSLSYTLPKRWSQKIKLDNASIFLNGQNLWTITNYKGLDPELQQKNLVVALPRVIVAGVKIVL